VYLSIGDDGDFNIRQFLFQLISNPKDIFHIIRLGKKFSRAKKTMLELKKVVLKL
jgi:hypothetical protein